MPVLSVTMDQDIDLAGNTTDVYEITFTVAGRPGIFTERVPTNVSDPVAEAAAAIGATKAQVESIYAIGV